jgi:hypothetical protein
MNIRKGKLFWYSMKWKVVIDLYLMTASGGATERLERRCSPGSSERG